MQVHTDRPKLVATLGDWDRLNLSTANIKLGVNRKHSEPDSKAGHLFHIATFPCSMFSIQRVLIEKNNTGFCTTLNVNIKDIPFFMAIINNKNKPKFSVYNIMRNYTHSIRTIKKTIAPLRLLSTERGSVWEHFWSYLAACVLPAPLWPTSRALPFLQYLV